MEFSWGIPDLISRSFLHGFEINDTRNNEPIGWAFIVRRNGFFDIEEFFVRPMFRGQGYGRKLVKAIQGNRRIKAPLRAWISHADSALGAPAQAVLRRLGLKAEPCSERWASYVATTSRFSSAYGRRRQEPKPARPLLSPLR